MPDKLSREEKAKILKKAAEKKKKEKELELILVHECESSTYKCCIYEQLTDD